MEQTNYQFVDRTGATESTSEIFGPVLIKKEAIEKEIDDWLAYPLRTMGGGSLESSTRRQEWVIAWQQELWFLCAFSSRASTLNGFGIIPLW